MSGPRCSQCYRLKRPYNIWSTYSHVPHINRTRPKSLQDEQLLAIEGLRMAISTLAVAAPKCRDHQTAPPEGFSKAQNKHRSRLEGLDSVMQES